MPGVYPKVQKFIRDHKTCGKVTGKVTVPTESGYNIHLNCSCGSTQDLFVTPEDARYDLIFSTMICSAN